MIEGECRHLPDRVASFDRQTPGPYLVASRNVIKKMSDSGGRGWRLPAPEIESAVASATYTILSDEDSIANALPALGIKLRRITSAT